MFTKIVFNKFYVFICLSLIFSGCTSMASGNLSKHAKSLNKKVPNEEDFFNKDLAAMDLKVVEEETGSLWSNSYSSRLFDNMYRASKVGDTIMIVVDEKASALNKGDTKSNKKMEQTNGIDNLGGLMTKITSLISAFSPANIIQGTTDSKFKGDAETKRSGQLNAKITATVQRVLRNGNLLLKGEQHIKINKEEQVLVVEGIIRPYDIGPDNTILSSALADARISYTGFGIVAERQSPGWLVRALDHIWPF